VREFCRVIVLGGFTLCLALEGALGACAAEGPKGQGEIFQSLSLGSRKEPIHIDADVLEVDYKGSTIVYRGSVNLRQGDVTLTSDRLTITYDPEAVKRASDSTPKQRGGGENGAARIREVVAEGTVRIRQHDRLAEGGRAVFDQAKQTIVLSDGAVLHDGPNQVTGERVVVYLQEERSVVESGAKSRVQGVFFPGKQEGEDGHDAAGGREQTARSEAAKSQSPAPR